MPQVTGLNMSSRLTAEISRFRGSRLPQVLEAIVCRWQQHNGGCRDRSMATPRKRRVPCGFRVSNGADTVAADNRSLLEQSGRDNRDSAG